MNFKLFLPVIILATLQLGFFFVYGGFSFYPDVFSRSIVSAIYLFFIGSIIFFCFFCKNEKKYIIKEEIKNIKIKKIDIIILFLVFILIIKPTIIMLIMGNEFGFDYIRQNFFSSDIIRGKAFGNMTLAILVQNYFVPFLWFYILMMISNKNTNSRDFLFFFFLFSLIFFNLSYAGRFYIYFSLIVLYLKVVIQGGSLFLFFKKYLLISFILVLLSFFILELRENQDQIYGDEKNSVLVLFEYHVLQPFFFSQKIYNGDISYNGYPFRTLIEGTFSPIYYLLGTNLNELPQGYYPIVFSEFTLYSSYSDLSYNAFATFFPYFYCDFGVLSPIFIFFIILYILFSSKLISNRDIRMRFLGFISLMLYFSLFQSTILSYGCLLIVFFFPIFHYIWKKQ